MPSKPFLFALALLFATSGLRPAAAAEDGVITLLAETGEEIAPAPGAVPGQRVLIRRAVAGGPAARFQVALPPKALFLAAEPAQNPDGAVELEIVGDAVVAPIPMKKVAYLGVSTSAVPASLASHLKLPEGFGLTVDHLQPGEPAEKAGLLAHDVLVKFGDQKLVNAMQLGTLVRAQKPGDEVELAIIREGKEMKVKVVLIEKEVPAFTVAQPADVIEFVPGEPGLAFPPIEWAPAEGPLKWTQKAGQGSMKYADGEHQLEIKTDKNGRTLIVKDKEGKEIFSGPINKPDERKAVPQAVKPKLEKLEKSTNFRAQRIAPGAFAQPGAGGAIELELVEPFDGADLKAMIEEQLKGLKLDGAEGEQLNKSIEEMKKQIDEMMKKTRGQQERIRGGFAPGAPAVPGVPGQQRHEFKQSSASSMIQMNDGTHAITIKSDGEGKHVTVKDQDGKELFAGPLNTDEDRAKVPAELREKLDRIEKSVKVGAKGAAGIFGGRAAPAPPAERERAEKEEDR